MAKASAVAAGKAKASAVAVVPRRPVFTVTRVAEAQQIGDQLAAEGDVVVTDHAGGTTCFSPAEFGKHFEGISDEPMDLDSFPEYVPPAPPESEPVA